jgi:hypothetical protein
VAAQLRIASASWPFVLALLVLAGEKAEYCLAWPIEVVGFLI